MNVLFENMAEKKITLVICSVVAPGAGHLMSCIVGLNDGADEQNKWVRVLKDVEEVCLRHGGQRRSHAADVVLNRVNNEVQLGKDGVPEPLLGREGNQEKQALHKIRRIQKIARGTAENERTLEAAMFQVRLRS